MSYWMWMIIVALVAMVWTMLRYHVEPMIILALLVCVSLLAISVMFVAEAARDVTDAKVARLEILTAKAEERLKMHEQRINDIETL